MTNRAPILLLFASLLPSCGFAEEHVIKAAGATFPAPLYVKWFRAYEERHPGLHFDYSAVGSGDGVKRLKDGSVDLAASDMPLNDEQVGALGFPVAQLPSVLGAVAPVYNLQGAARDLKFTPEVLAAIFLGRITKWTDPAIRALNRDMPLPDRPIAVVHRSDDSGTTFVLSDFLAKTSPQWKNRIQPATTIEWPVGTGAQGNEGVAEKVQQTPDSIGYVEFIYALQNHLSYGSVKNAAGRFVQPSLDSIAAAAASAVTKPEDFRVSITNAPGSKAYPIASFTYILIPQKPREPWKSQAIRDFLTWMLTFGQRQSAALGYGSLPPAIIAHEQQVAAGIQ